MASSSLVLHGGGAREVSLEQLQGVACPEPTETYFPIPHHRVLERCVSTLEQANFEVQAMRLCLARSDQQFFATIDLKTVVSPSVNLCVGLRSSMNRSLPLGLVAGNRVFCCSNLSFRADLINVRRKHSKFGETHFSEAICRAVQALHQFKIAEAARIRRFQLTDISDTEAESFILRAHEKGVISNRYLLRVLREFRQPSFDEFTEHGKTLWRLEQAFTTCLGQMERQFPRQYARATLNLHSLFSDHTPASEVPYATAS